jgi:nucleotide-binding universal stress UspA family protein
MVQLKKILLPTDFSESAQHALGYASSFAAAFHAEISLLHVVETLAVGYASDLFPVPMADVFQEVADHAQSEIARLAAELRKRGLVVHEKVVQGKPSAEIVRIAREDAVDLIVLGTHGKGMLDQALFGSTMERVVRRAPCPVLTCRPVEHALLTG